MFRLVDFCCSADSDFAGSGTRNAPSNSALIRTRNDIDYYQNLPEIPDDGFLWISPCVYPLILIPPSFDRGRSEQSPDSIPIRSTHRIVDQ
ncbi:MAG: hypothetical protein CMJ95_10670 [Planctomycetes bacterium]|nr:hypothetical protein [Planctomycetota bacterium]